MESLLKVRVPHVLQKKKKESDLLWYVQFQLAFVSGLLVNTMGYGQKPYAFVSC